MNEEIIARAEAFLSTPHNCVLALVDADGYPTAATITPSSVEGIKRVTFGNHVESNWVQRVQQCDRASICFTMDSPECNITLVGTVEVLADDMAIKKAHWRNWMDGYYSGPEDAHFCVLWFTTRRYSLFVGGKQVRGMV